MSLHSLLKSKRKWRRASVSTSKSDKYGSGSDWQQLYHDYAGSRKDDDSGTQHQQLQDPRAQSPTLFGMLASKRLAKQLAGKMYAKREFLPTYRMQPDARFDCVVVYDIIKNRVDSRMQEFT